MGTYIGFIEKQGTYFNFKPLAEIREDNILLLSDSDRETLLPDSAKLNINFSYERDQLNKMEEYFSDKCLVAFEFVLSDLEDNFYRNGFRNPTGYTVNTLDMIASEKIRKISAFNVYQVISAEDILSDFYNDSRVEINTKDITDSSQIFVDLGNFYAGPYEVWFRSHTQTFHIQPQIKISKYTINGYSKEDISPITLSYFDKHWSSEYRWTVVYATDTAKVEQLDVITDTLLLENFRESIDVENIKDSRVVIDDIDILLKQYETSLLTGSKITDPVRQKRRNRLLELLTSEAELTDTLTHIAQSLCSLLIRHKDNPEVDEWVKELLSKHPEFWEQIHDVRSIASKINQLQQTVEGLQLQKDSLDAQIQEQNQAAEAITLQAIEETKKERLALDTEYATSRARLDALLSILGMAENIIALRTEVTYLEEHKRRLADDCGPLESKFTQLISQTRDKMLDIAFDGFMANKMLRAAAEWEAEEVQKLTIDFVKEANKVEATEKSPEELIKYLVDTVQVVRPKYSNNTIINIATCITQGFLTVFSGDPGCGKTSICNIIADVLGLNKIEDIVQSTASDFSATRYVPVSVERGWTSKRDFIGYFNPLSKSFDKSNRDVYDALKRLDMEQDNGLNRFPFLILLDEANLSPMEYYWADFMYICDNMEKNRQINLGEDNVLKIPNTLHFVATINNDHTVETLSPRLIDRAWIIQLPRQTATTATYTEIPKEKIELITWDSLCHTFALPANQNVDFSPDIQTIYDDIIKHLRKERLYISPRIDIAIKRYWAVASKFFTAEFGVEPSVVALDYAISQKFLPKIQGYGNEYEKWLTDLYSILDDHNLNASATIVDDIIKRSPENTKYFQFFG